MICTAGVAEGTPVLLGFAASLFLSAAETAAVPATELVLQELTSLSLG